MLGYMVQQEGKGFHLTYEELKLETLTFYSFIVQSFHLTYEELKLQMSL
mgnify:CR=1 FL=1